MKRIISVITALVLVSTMLMAFTSCGSSDGDAVEVRTTVEVETTMSVTPVDYSTEWVLNYFNERVNELKNLQPMLYYYYEINVPDDTLKIREKGKEDSDDIPDALVALNEASAGIKDIILENIKEVSGELPEGADNSEYLYVKGESYVSALTLEDIQSATVKEAGNFYYITIKFKDYEAGEDVTSLTKAFELRDKDEILASEEFAKTSSYLKLNDYSVGYSNCQITAKIDRTTNQVVNLNYYKAANVVVDMTGAGTYKELGDVSVIFTLEDKANFDFVWESQLPVSPLDTTVASEPTTAVAG